SERAHGPPRRLLVERHLAAEEALRVEVAEHAGGVGHGRALATASVARRSRVGPGALRADPQQAAGVDPRDRAAAGADRAHVDRGQPGVMAAERLPEPGLAGEHGRAVADEADVETRPPGVADDRVIGA